MTLNPRSLLTHRALRSSHGFTVLEMLLVLAILGLLVGLAVTNVEGVFGSAKVQTAEMFVKQSIKVPLTSYRMAMGDYPSTAEGLQALITPPANRSGRWNGPYLSEPKVPLDPWGRPYQYRYPGTHNKNGYDLFSLGPDGQESDDDVRNW
jgi:general secretion pathway protein G